MSLLGIDIGTTGVRAAAYDHRGTFLTSRSADTSLIRTDDGWVETDAEALLVAIERVVHELVSCRELRRDPVVALSFSVQGEAVVPVDSAGVALANAPVSMDRRGEPAVAVVEQKLGGARIQHITGQPVHSMFSIYKIAVAGAGWIGDDVAGFRCLDGFVAARWGAENAVDWSMAARTGAFDVNTRQWSAEILDAARSVAGSSVDESMLPRPVAPATVIGAVSADAAARTGLSEGTPILAGMHDQAASFIGAGGRKSTAAVFALGSSDCLTIASSVRPAVDGTGFASYPITESLWLTLAGTAAGGWALDWFSRLLGEELAEVFDNPAPLPPALLALPYFTGSGTLDNDPSARGVLAGLSLDTTRAELVRAFLEATGFELAKITQALATAGIATPAVHAVGGGAANHVALEIRANAAGLPLLPVRGYASARGAALLAGIGIGVFASVNLLPDAATGSAALPDPTTRAWYDSQRAAFCALYQVMRPINEALSSQKVKP